MPANAVVVKRPRGRPPKTPEARARAEARAKAAADSALAAADSPLAAAASSAAAPSSVKRPRGRPRKTPLVGNTAALVQEEEPTPAAVVKRPRGRPRKTPAVVDAPAALETPPVVKRPRGRPAKKTTEAKKGRAEAEARAGAGASSDAAVLAATDELHFRGVERRGDLDPYGSELILALEADGRLWGVAEYGTTKRVVRGTWSADGVVEYQFKVDAGLYAFSGKYDGTTLGGTLKSLEEGKDRWGTFLLVKCEA